MIRTAEQILADIAASGGDAAPPDMTASQHRTRRRKGPSPKWPEGHLCEAPRCTKAAPGRQYCRGHRWRLATFGDVQADKDLYCRCGQCPRTLRQPHKRGSARPELVGDVWLDASIQLVAVGSAGCCGHFHVLGCELG